MKIKTILNYLVQLAGYKYWLEETPCINKLHAEHFIALLEILKNL